jgi:glycosyltransferase involved in cell wall biosynthesis
MTVRVLDVIPALSTGGAGRAVLATATAGMGTGSEHRIASLRPADPGMVAAARRAGLFVVDATDRAQLRDELAAADIVLLHFWNSPELYELLRSGLPPARLLVWSHVAGDRPPQVLPAELVVCADQVVASTPATTSLPGMDTLEAVPAVGGWDRLSGSRPSTHRGFTVGYIGTVDAVKMHPRFVELGAAINVPGLRIIVCGDGGGLRDIRREIAARGLSDRFEVRGHIEDVASVYSELDVFGYPLSPENYSASELVLQDAMFAGVPPVLLPHGAASLSVEHGRTGLVAADENEYVLTIERLYADPDLRDRLGRAAAAHARRAWDPDLVARRWTEIYRAALERPKRARIWPWATSEGGPAFVRALGDGVAEDFVTSMRDGLSASAATADRSIAECSPLLAFADGGILDYRRRYPHDRWLRLWSGLALLGRGRRVLAAGELASAVKLGCDASRVAPYLTEAMA